MKFLESLLWYPDCESGCEYKRQAKVTIELYQNSGATTKIRNWYIPLSVAREMFYSRTEKLDHRQCASEAH